MEVVVRPDHRKPDDEVGVEPAVGRAGTRSAAEGGGHVHLWVPKPTADTDAMAESCGLHRGRDLYQMRRPLPVDDDHPEIATRPFRPGVDEAAWLAVNNRAFASHPEQGGWDLDTILEREAEPWFDPEGFLLHERDGRLAASCWTKVHHDTEPPWVRST